MESGVYGGGDPAYAFGVGVLMVNRLFPTLAGEWWEIGEVANALLVEESRLRALITQLNIPIREITIRVHGVRPAKGEMIHIKAVRQLAALSRKQLIGW